MPAAHLTPDQVKSYLARTTSPAETLAISDHLLECVQCRDWLRAQEEARPAGEISSVGFEEMAALLHDELPPLERRSLVRQISSSTQLTTELRDLQKWKAELDAAAAGRERRPVPRLRWLWPLAAALIVGLAVLWWVDAGRSSSIALRDGGRELRFDRDGHSNALAALPAELAEAISNAIRLGEVDLKVTGLGESPGVLASGANTSTGFEVLAPVATAIRTTPPRFRWTEMPEATAYRIYVMDESTGSIALTETTSAADWTPAQPLAAGKHYQWQVEALRGEEVIARTRVPPEPEARFRILGATENAELEALERRSGASHLVLGVAKARAGLRDEALEEFRVLREENPGSALAAKLYLSLGAKVPRPR